MKKLVVSLLGVLLLALPLLGVLAQEASAASSRVAVIKELKGSVNVKKSGGSKDFTAFAKMSLNEGDILTVGTDGSAVLQFANGSSEDDKMTVSANTTLTFSKLKEGKNTVTKVSVQNGSVWSTVKSIKSADDQFTLETPTAVMGVRGTNLFVGVNPLTGDSRFVIASGAGQVLPTNTRSGPTSPVVVFPDQQVTIDDRDETNEFPDEVIPVDLQALLNGISPEVIAAILQAKNDIDRENEEFIRKKREELQGGQTDPAIGMNTLEDLNRITQNLNNLVANMLQEALRSNKVSQEQLQSLIDEANRTLTNKIDLANTPPPVLTDAEKLKMERIKKQEEARLEAIKKQQEADNKRRLEELAKKVEEEKKKREEANQKALEEAKKKAKEEYEKKLAEAEKKRFEEERKKREEELKNRTPQPSAIPSPSAGGGGGGSSGGGNSGGNNGGGSDPSPNPSLPSGITKWTMTTPNDQPLAIQRTKQTEYGNIYAVKTATPVSSLKLKLEFGSDVSKVTLMPYSGESQAAIEWNISGEVKTIEGLEVGYERFSIYVTKKQSDSSSGQLSNTLFVLNGVPELEWPRDELPLQLIGEFEYPVEYEKIGDSTFRADVPLSAASLIMYPEEYLIESIKVNGLDYPNEYNRIDLPVGEAVIEIKMTDPAYYFTHTYTLIVNRSSMPGGLLSWEMNASGQQIAIQTTTSGSLYAIVPPLSQTQSITLNMELADGYTGTWMQEGNEGEPQYLGSGLNSLQLPVLGEGYYRYSLQLWDSMQNNEYYNLTVKIGNGSGNEELNAGGIDFYTGVEQRYSLNYAGALTYVGVLPADITEGWLNLDYFLGEFFPWSIESEDIQLWWNDSIIKEDGYYYLEDLQPGLNQLYLRVDPLRLFGGSGFEYKLNLYVGEVPASLQIAALTATDDAQQPNTIQFANTNSLTYVGQFDSAAIPPVLYVDLRIELSDPGTNIEWLEQRDGFGDFTTVSAQPNVKSARVMREGNFFADMSIVLVDINGNRMLYDIYLHPNTEL